MYKKIILFTFMFILLNISIVNAEELDEIYTWQDLKSYAEQLKLDTTFNEFSQSYTNQMRINLDQFTTFYDFFVNKCAEYNQNPALSYGTILRFVMSGTQADLAIVFLTENSRVTSTGGVNDNISNCNVLRFWTFNNGSIPQFRSYTEYTTYGISTSNASGCQHFGLTNGKMRIYNKYQNFENKWIYFTPKNEEVEVNVNDLKLGTQRTGNIYFNSNLIYELVNEDLLLSIILNYDNNNIYFNSSYIYDLYLPALDNIKNSKNYYINIINENNTTIYTSNKFEIEVTNSNGSSIITNTSGEVIGSINNDNIINSINNLNNTQNEFNNRFFNNSISGDLTTPQINLENPGEQFYMNIYNNIVNGLKNEDVQYIDLVLFNGDTYRIYSNSMQWSVPGLDEFIYIIWWGGFGYAFFKLVYWTYEKVSQGDIMGLINEIENDKDIL